MHRDEARKLSHRRKRCECG